MKQIHGPSQRLSRGSTSENGLAQVFTGKAREDCGTVMKRFNFVNRNSVMKIHVAC